MRNIRVVKAQYLNEYRIDIEFSNGFRNIIDLKEELWGEVFEPLNDLKYFKNFKINPFTIYWENGADFSPEFLYELAEKKEFSVADKKTKY
jgi:hypothetical protein